MARSKEEISSILSDLNLKRDTYNLIKYSDEVVEVAKTKYGNILNRTSIIEIIREFKENNKFKYTLSFSKFIDIIVYSLKIFKPINIINEYNGTTVVRYIANYTYISPYEIALSLLSRSFLSHYSALYVNDLTLNKPKDIYINKEQSKKYKGDSPMISQSRIDYAFSKKMRRTNMTYSFNYDNIYYKVHVLNSKNTNNTGIITKNVLGFSSPIRTTNIERTLVDVVVRPGYSGGTTEILEAFILAKNISDESKIWDYLKKFDYSYPYYKSIAFYMKYTGYDYKEVLKKRYGSDYRNDLIFYLDYQMINTHIEKEIGIYFPKILQSFMHKESKE